MSVHINSMFFSLFFSLFSVFHNDFGKSVYAIAYISLFVIIAMADHPDKLFDYQLFQPLEILLAERRNRQSHLSVILLIIYTNDMSLSLVHVHKPCKLLLGYVYPFGTLGHRKQSVLVFAQDFK